jgi:hypothetical protein
LLSTCFRDHYGVSKAQETEKCHAYEAGATNLLLTAKIKKKQSLQPKSASKAESTQVNASTRDITVREDLLAKESRLLTSSLQKLQPIQSACGRAFKSDTDFCASLKVPTTQLITFHVSYSAGRTPVSKYKTVWCF